MNHSLEDPLQVGEGSVAYWAERPDRCALVFVHGLLGKAVKTWRNFPRLLLQDASLDGWDLVFFGYESAKRQVAKSAEEFLNFLEQLAMSPESLMNVVTQEAASARPRSAATPFYEQIYVVAHSLGAPVVRHALLQAKEDAPWAPSVRLVFYAPGHAGAKGVDSLVDAVGDRIPGLRFFLKLKLRFMPVLDDVVGKTEFLKQLRERTQKKLALGGHGHLVAKAIIDAEFETVVDQVKFIDEDPDGKMIRGSKHSDVCKPKDSRPEPFQRLRGLL